MKFPKKWRQNEDGVERSTGSGLARLPLGADWGAVGPCREMGGGCCCSRGRKRLALELRINCGWGAEE